MLGLLAGKVEECCRLWKGELKGVLRIGGGMWWVWRCGRESVWSEERMVLLE